MKKLFWYLLLIFIVVVIITLVTIINKKVIPTPQKQDETSIKLATLNNIDKKIDYFNYKYYFTNYLPYCCTFVTKFHFKPPYLNILNSPELLFSSILLKPKFVKNIFITA